eukprot:CAMPEP_0116139502 /NCGR_PEP_ID=MMETSP0329-20121206/13348_1 /TAXON_ID=697910 /ORGANISM="Pseudo-nitzschia arenysensis, Strain B593" /LENGTH=398 /DNA_ID=CAMNT_0003634553 /DNA_START=184 /DNA_END=1380 /DNA_ORIENTATION=+
MKSFLQYFQLALILSSTVSDAFCPMTPSGQTACQKSSSSLHISFSSPEEDSDYQRRRNPDISNDQASLRRIEFADLGPLEESSERKRRRQQEEEDRQRFIKYGDDLWNMRDFMGKLSRKLLKSINEGDREREEEIREELRQIEHQDPDLVYKIELEKLQQAKSEGRDKDAMKHSMVASAARSCLPQFNLDGLWVGKYGVHGYEMINVTYHGDLMIAYKVTGDKNVPRGEITFQVDLNPIKRRTVDSTGGDSGNTIEPLQPISLTEKAAKKWGTTQLPRHKGLGQVAEQGFTKNQWMEGQLIIIGEEYFSFAWVPIEQQIFFGRPSPELALKMLRESGSASIAPTKKWKKAPTIDADVDTQKEYIHSCLEMTTENEDELNGDPFSCIWTGDDTEECYFE